MPVFEYHALNNSGKVIKGTVDADSVRAARQKLRTQNIFPTEIKESLKASQESKKKDVKRLFSIESSARSPLFPWRQQCCKRVTVGFLDSPQLRLDRIWRSLVRKTDQIQIRHIVGNDDPHLGSLLTHVE